MLIKKIIGDRVVVENPSLLYSKSETGLVLSQQGEMAIYKAKVVAAGRDCKDVKEGDWVVYKKGLGFEIMWRGGKYTFLREDNIDFVMDETELKTDQDES